MNKQVQIFKNEKLNFEVKMKLDNGDELYDAETVARSLGLVSVSAKGGRKYENVRWSRVNKYLKLFGTSAELKHGDFISEAMVYKLAFKANNEVAENFQDWLAVDVIPQIRKTGGYIQVDNNMSDDEIMAKALMVAQRTINKKDELLKAKTEELQEKNRFLNQISASSNSILVRDVAHLATKHNLKIGEKRLWNKLREWGLIQKNSTNPMQRALEQGLFEKSEFVIQRSRGVETKFTTRVTGKGQVYIIDRLLREVI